MGLLDALSRRNRVSVDRLADAIDRGFGALSSVIPVGLTDAMRSATAWRV